MLCKISPLTRCIFAAFKKDCSFQVVLSLLAVAALADPQYRGLYPSTRGVLFRHPGAGYRGHAIGYAAAPRFAYSTRTESLAYPGASAVSYAGSPAINIEVARPVAVAPVAAPVVAKAAPVAPVVANVAHAPLLKAVPAVPHQPVAVVKEAVPVPKVESSQYHAQDEAGNYEYGYNNINSAKHERGNAYAGTVEGTYSYIDGHGLPQKVDYVADNLGFRATGTNFVNTAATSGIPAPVLGRYRRAPESESESQYLGTTAYGAVNPGYGNYYAQQPLAYNGYNNLAYNNLGYNNLGYNNLGYSVNPGYYNTYNNLGLYGNAAYNNNLYNNAAAFSSTAALYPETPVAAVHAAPVVAAASQAPVAPAGRYADLVRVKNNPGHAVSYRVY